jgi:hypothetical protein
MKRAWWELGLVVLTGTAHLVFENLLHAKGPFIAGAGLFWIGYVAWRLRTPGQAAEWGLRGDTLRPSILANAALFAVGAPAMIVFGASQGRAIPSPGFFYLLGVYPVWGLIQQFLLCALIGRNLRAISGSAKIAAVVATLLFGAVHAPDWTLCALTATAGLAWLAIYFRWPNLWAQGLSHGWLGAVAYFYILGRDPWLELLQSLE